MSLISSIHDELSTNKSLSRTWNRFKKLYTPRAMGGLVVAMALFFIGFIPLFDGPGYEHSLASGLLVPLVTSLVAAYESFQDRKNIVSTPPFQSLVRGITTGAWLAVIALITSFIHTLRVGACDVWGGCLTFFLGPFLGSILAGALGCCVPIATGHFFAPHRHRRRFSVLIALLFPISSFASAIALFYKTPAVFAFDPFVGFFSGTLYDEVVDAYGPLTLYRMGTVATLSALLFFSSLLTRNEQGRTQVASIYTHVFQWVMSCVALTTSVLMIVFGSHFGHWSTAASVRKTLGGERVGHRCHIVFPRDLSTKTVDLLLRDCEEQLTEVEASLKIQGPPQITAFFFHDASQKRKLIGAANTYIAKPWRREVYLQIDSYPHSVLGHELAHVVAGTIAHGPFSVAGSARGWFPNPGLIEGIAVAASPHEDDLTPMQWAAAMKRLNVLPSLERIFSTNFLAQNSSLAYTVAGAFIRYLFDTDRTIQVQKWYSGVRFEDAFQQSLQHIEKEWIQFLDSISLPSPAFAIAEERFKRPAIWARRCPHVVERLRDEANHCRSQHDYVGVERRLKKLLHLAPQDPSARFQLSKNKGAQGDRAAMLAAFQKLARDAKLSNSWKARIAEALGDESLAQLNLEHARVLYEQAQRFILDDDWLRSLDVKIFISASVDRAKHFGPLLIEAMRADEDLKSRWLALAYWLGRNENINSLEQKLAYYLLARRFLETDSFENADLFLAKATPQLETISLRVQRERAKLQILAACMLPVATREQKVSMALDQFSQIPNIHEGRRVWVERMARRCTSSATKIPF